MSRRFPYLLIALIAVTVVGCGDGAEPEPIEIGEGSLPSTMPRDFPVPPNAVIGSTLIDRVNHRTEVTLTMQEEMVPVVQYFQVGLVNAGYVVTRSEGDRSRWNIEFSKGELMGTIDVNYNSGVAVLFVEVNTA
jgi:dUTPase